jgi:hypothetical protein
VARTIFESVDEPRVVERAEDPHRVREVARADEEAIDAVYRSDLGGVRERELALDLDDSDEVFLELRERTRAACAERHRAVHQRDAADAGGRVAEVRGPEFLGRGRSERSDDQPLSFGVIPCGASALGSACKSG